MIPVSSIPLLNDSVLKLIELAQIFPNIGVFKKGDFKCNHITLKLNLHKELFIYPQVKWFHLPAYRVICDRRTFEFVLPKPK